MINRTFWWKMAFAGFVALVVSTSVVALLAGKEDNRAKRLVAANIKITLQAEKDRADRIHELNAINHAQCKSLRNLYLVLARTIAESDESISKVEYFRRHPAEARAAHERNRMTLRSFRSPPCPPDVTLPTGPTPAGNKVP